MIDLLTCFFNLSIRAMPILQSTLFQVQIVKLQFYFCPNNFMSYNQTMASPKRFLLVTIPVMLALSACTAVFPFASARDIPQPSLKILIPGDNPRVGLNGIGDCPVAVEVANFKLADKPGEANIPGEGHLHYFLDTEHQEIGAFIDSIDTIHFWQQVGDGRHVFRVELVNNDHSPLNPPVTATARTSAGNYWDS
jgi:hypothetical protein